MSLPEVAALVLILFLLSQLVAIPLGATIGKRVGKFRWFLIGAACVALTAVSVVLLTKG